MCEWDTVCVCLSGHVNDEIQAFMSRLQTSFIHCLILRRRQSCTDTEYKSMLDDSFVLIHVWFLIVSTLFLLCSFISRLEPILLLELLSLLLFEFFYLCFFSSIKLSFHCPSPPSPLLNHMPPCWCICPEAKCRWCKEGGSLRGWICCQSKPLAIWPCTFQSPPPAFFFFFLLEAFQV